MTLAFATRLARIGGLVLLTSITPALADTSDDLVPEDLPSSLSGSYLAARSADQARDIGAALDYFEKAVELDAENPALLERLVTLRLANGGAKEARQEAEALILADPGNPISRLTLAIDAMTAGKYAEAVTQFDKGARAPLANLTGGLIGAWAKFGLGDTDGALARVDALIGPNWYSIFRDYHHALIADAAGRTSDALAAITRAYATDSTALTVVRAYAWINAKSGNRAEADKAIAGLAGNRSDHPMMQALIADLKSGKTNGPLMGSPRDGAAEVLYGLGSALGVEDGADLSQGYLQLAHELKPNDELMSLALGDLFQIVKNCEKAVDYYSLVKPTSPYIRNADVQTGACLEQLGKTEAAAERIKRVVDRDPSDIDAVMALGNLYRAHDRFTEAAETLTRGIATIKTPAKADWPIYYSRGVALERSKRWPEAERDFQQALKLDPEQAAVLNYLGYSWVDMGLHLDKALDMIRKAVSLREDDGYIVDSLGWAYYRLARYDEAVQELERAVELKAADPTINDHLGDAYWQVGRKLEARFQWNHARDLGPEKDALPAILEKIKNGLVAAVPQKVADNNSGQKTATDATPQKMAAVDPKDVTAPTTVQVQPGESLSSLATRFYGSPDDYTIILEANRSRITDPNRIFPGMTLTIPARGTQQ